MKCNVCNEDLDGRAIATTCGHLFCTEDASKILSNEAACPVCDSLLSKSHMKPVDVNPSEEWTDMAMVGMKPLDLMESAYRSVMFCISQKEVEMQYKMNCITNRCGQKFEQMQEKFTEKLEQVHTAYQKMAKRFQMLEQKSVYLWIDKQELQQQFDGKSREKRKLDEMYDQLRSEYESVKRSAIQPASNFNPRTEPDLFTNPTNMMGSMDSMRKDWGIFTPETPSNWFDIQGASPAKRPSAPADNGNRRHSGHPSFGAGASNPSMTLRNLIISRIKRPQLSRNRQRPFTV